MLNDLIAVHQKRLDAAQVVLDTDGNLYTHEQRASARIEAAQEREHLRQLHAAQVKLGIADCPRFRHKTRGTTYVEMDVAIAQCEATIHDNDPVTVYRGTDGQLYIRPPEEFGDGRFEALDGKRPLKEYERRGRQIEPVSQDIWVDLKLGARRIPWSFDAATWNSLPSSGWQFTIFREHTDDVAIHGRWEITHIMGVLGERKTLELKRVA